MVQSTSFILILKVAKACNLRQLSLSEFILLSTIKLSLRCFATLYFFCNILFLIVTDALTRFPAFVSASSFDWLTGVYGNF